MMFQRINQSSPERVFIVVYNSYGTAMTNGMCVRWDYTTDVDGVGIERCTAASTGFPAAGVIAETIAASAYGLMQIYGYHSAVRVRSMTDSGHAYHTARAEVAAGVALAYDITADVLCAEGIGSNATNGNLYPFAFALAAQASYTTKAIAAFIKAM